MLLYYFSGKFGYFTTAVPTGSDLLSDRLGGRWGRDLVPGGALDRAVFYCFLPIPDYPAKTRIPAWKNKYRAEQELRMSRYELAAGGRPYGQVIDPLSS